MPIFCYISTPFTLATVVLGEEHLAANSM